MTPSRSIRRRAPLLLSLATLAFGLVGFLVAEGVARLAEPPERRDQRIVEVESLDTQLHYLTPCFAYGAPRRTSGRRRVIVVGESSGSYTAAQLARHLPAEDAELFDCAMAGSALEHVALRIEEALRAEPDELVVVFGHNLRFRYRTDAWSARLQAIRARSALLTAIRLRGGALPPLWEAAFADETRHAALESMLRDTARRARPLGVRVTVATMAGNLFWPAHDFPRNEHDGALLDARLLEARGRRDEAIRVLEARLSSGPPVALWEWELGLMLAAAGRLEEAGVWLRRASVADPAAGRASDAANDLVRRVAREEQLLLLDTARRRAAESAGGLVGFDALLDNCHLLPQEYEREARVLAALLGFRAPPPGTSLAEVEGRGFESDLSWNDAFGRLVKSFDALSGGERRLRAFTWYGLRMGRRSPEAFRSWARSLAPEPALLRSRLLAAVAEGALQAGATELSTELASSALAAAPTPAARVARVRAALGSGAAIEAALGGFGQTDDPALAHLSRALAPAQPAGKPRP
jgi:tetratricopeptide (TPR) repeat protein